MPRLPRQKIAMGLLYCVSLLYAPIYGQSGAIINVPATTGSPIMIDGNFSPDEWRDALVIPASASVKIYVQQVKGHVFIGIRKETGPPVYVDLFLVTGESRLHNLHASMQLGERLLSGDKWTDTEPATSWGVHHDWTANEAKSDPKRDRNLPIAERLLPADGVEFQLRRSRFSGKQWQVRIEVRDFVGKAPDIVFPPNSTRTSPAHWAVFSLEEN